MIDRLLADAILLLHFLFVAFVVAGGLLLRRWPRLAWLHLPAAAWAAAVELSGWICPLTPLENRLRERAGLARYSGDFLEHYLVPLLYPQNLSRKVQVLLGGIVLVSNAVVYAVLLARARRSASRIGEKSR